MGSAAASLPLLERDPDATLFRDRAGPLTAAVFARAVRRVAESLPDGVHVANLCTDRRSFAIVFAAALLRGQISLCTSDRSAGRLRALAEQYAHTYSVSNDSCVTSPLRHLQLDAAHEPGAGAADLPAIAADRVVAHVFTSGTTGEAVAHAKSWGALAVRSAAAATQFGWITDRPIHLVATVPPQHMYGLETSVLLPLHAPGASWCGAAFYPQDVSDALAAGPAPRVLVTTPLQLQALLRAGLALPPLACVISATAPLDPALAAAAERSWDTEVREIYGATEIGSVASRRTTEGDPWRTYPGIRLVADGGGLAVAAPHAAPHPLSDIVEVLDDRRFRLLGRRADLLKLGGRRASLAGLTAILNRIEGVADGVFVAPDDLDRRPSARMLAYVVSGGASAETILAALRRELDPVFLPRRVVLVPALPRNDVGKLTRAALVALQAQSGDA